jgi:hypothetical protein
MPFLAASIQLFVGDSFNNGQYVFASCIESSLRGDGSNSMKTFDSLTVLKAKEFPLSFNVTNEKT